MKKDQSILLVGGGTGGHVVPVFEIFKELKKEGIRVSVLGSGNAIERYFFEGVPEYRTILTGKLSRNFSLIIFKEILYALIGVFQTYFILKKNRPSIIFAKGGYVSWPVIFWAKILKIPFMIHESDIEMGATNKFASSKAKKVFVGFPSNCYPDVDDKKLVFVGQILGSGIGEKNHTMYDFGFRDKRPTLFVTGGSQGAMKINRIIFRILNELVLRYNIIHQTGAVGFAEAIEQRSRLSEQNRQYYYISDFLQRSESADLMRDAIIQSDLVIARAGATTIAEVAALKKPMILLPYKYAAANHQYKNALALEKVGGAIIFDDDAQAELLLKKVRDTMSDGEERAKIAKCAHEFFPTDGLSKIISELKKEIK